jgi:FkbH-like protein
MRIQLVLRFQLSCDKHGASKAKNNDLPSFAISSAMIRTQNTGAPISDIELDRAQMALPIITISATFRAEPVAEALAFWLRELRFEHKISFVPYNQVFQSLLDPSGALSATGDGFNIVLLRWQDLDSGSMFESNVSELAQALKTAASRCKQPILVLVCPPSPERASDVRYREVETRFVADVQAGRGVCVLTPAIYERWYPMGQHCDPDADRLGNAPYTSMGFAALATAIARRLDALRRPPFKVIVLDCDNTLWRGILGEEGVEGIRMDPPYQDIQRYMRAQRDAGMLLTISSKNILADVEEVFRMRQDMTLRQSDFVSWRVNSEAKSNNIRDLAAELGLGLDAFIFVDDSPTECAEVQSHCPEVLTVQLPEAIDEIPAFLDHVWAFDQWQITSEDKKLTAMYAEKLERERSQKSATNVAAFLAGLQLKIDINPVEPEKLPRVSELTQRTNQFNCTTIRRSESDLQALVNLDHYECLTADVSDRFGSYGLVGVVIYRVVGLVLEVDSFLLSSRAQGRGVEHRIVQHLGQIAISRGLQTVRIPFRPSAKNTPALMFLQSIGGEHKLENEGGFSVALPAQLAAEITHQQTVGEIVDDAVIEGPRKETATALPPLFREYCHLAVALREPEQIVGEIRRSRVPVSRTPEVEFVPPRNPVEQTLTGIWADILGLDRVGIHDNFFDLGGDSLRLGIVLSVIRRTFGRELSMVDLFRYTTVQRLSEHLTGPAEDPIFPRHNKDAIRGREDAARRRLQLRQRLTEKARTNTNDFSARS